MMVCLGWVPYNKSKSWKKQTKLAENIIEITEDDLPEGKGFYDSFSGFYYTADDSEEIFTNKQVNKYIVLEGFLRKGEEKDVLLGKNLDKEKGIVNMIDIKRMVGFHKFSNAEADAYYLERAVPDLEKEQN